LKNIDSKIAINLIILSETFYLKGDKKETIEDDIKKGSLFKNSSFWAGAIITEFEDNLKKLKLDIYQIKKSGLTNKTLSHAKEFVKAQFIPYLVYKINFEVPDDIFKNKSDEIYSVINPIRDRIDSATKLLKKVKGAIKNNKGHLAVPISPENIVEM